MLPGMKRGLAAADVEKVEPIKKMVGPLAPQGYKGSTSTSASEMRMVLIAIMSFLVGILFATYGPRLVGDLRISNGGLIMSHVNDRMSLAK